MRTELQYCVQQQTKEIQDLNVLSQAKLSIDIKIHIKCRIH